MALFVYKLLREEIGMSVDRISKAVSGISFGKEDLIQANVTKWTNKIVQCAITRIYHSYSRIFKSMCVSTKNTEGSNSFRGI